MSSDSGSRKYDDECEYMERSHTVKKRKIKIDFDEEIMEIEKTVAYNMYKYIKKKNNIEDNIAQYKNRQKLLFNLFEKVLRYGRQYGDFKYITDMKTIYRQLYNNWLKLVKISPDAVRPDNKALKMVKNSEIKLNNFVFYVNSTDDYEIESFIRGILNNVEYYLDIVKSDSSKIFMNTVKLMSVDEFKKSLRNISRCRISMSDDMLFYI